MPVVNASLHFRTSAVTLTLPDTEMIVLGSSVASHRRECWMRDNTEITSRRTEVPSASVEKPQLRRASLMPTTPSTAEALVRTSAGESEAALSTPTMMHSLQHLTGNKAVAELIGRSRSGRRVSDWIQHCAQLRPPPPCYTRNKVRKPSTKCSRPYRYPELVAEDRGGRC